MGHYLQEGKVRVQTTAKRSGAKRPLKDIRRKMLLEIRANLVDARNLENDADREVLFRNAEVRVQTLAKYFADLTPGWSLESLEQKLRICAAPDCDKIFLPHPKRITAQKYHSKTCRSRHNMQKRRSA